jgi:Tfp pilus assembly PilM family ATPase/Tfp pilus assembly protein PilN
MALGIGIELAPAAVRGVIVEPSGSRVKLVAAREVACETARLDALTRALVELRQHLRFSAPVVLGMPSASVIVTTISPLVVNAQRAALAVGFELQQQLPFNLADAVWHCHWLTNGTRRSGHGARGTGRGVVVAAMRRALLEERLAAARRAGLAVRTVSINPVAAFNAWAADRTAARPSGAPPGGLAAGSAEAVLLHLGPERQAEWIVWGPATLQVIPVSITSSEQPGAELAASWEALQLQGVAASTPIWLIGPEAVLPGLRQALAAQGRASVEPFDPARALSGAAGQLTPPDRWATAVGLALQGIGAARVSLNLLAGVQTHERARRIRRSASIASGSLTLILFAIGISGMLEVRQRRLRVLKALEQQERLYQTLRPEVRALLQQQERTERRTLQLEALISEARLPTRALSKIAEALPDPVWLTMFECAARGLLIEGLLEGRGKSFQEVTQFLDRLKSVAGMTTVKPLSSNVTTDPVTKQDVVAFSVQVQQPLRPEPEGGVPAAAADAKPETTTKKASPKKGTKAKGKGKTKASSDGETEP